MRNLDASPLVHGAHSGNPGQTALQSPFLLHARRVVAGFEPPENWRGDRVTILLLSIVLHSLGGWLWKQATVPVSAPRILNSIEVALVAPRPVAQPVPPVPQPQPVTPPQEAPNPKPKPKPKPVAKAPKRAEPKPEPEESAPAPPAAPSTPMPTATAPPGAPFVEASYQADYLNNPRPRYPDLALQRHWEGLVMLRVRVLTDGRSGEVAVERGSGHGVLDEAAVEAARRWRFVPARRGEETVASWVVIPIEFKLRK